ncbi:hypothetical protein [uncultured Dokdonia sp.]|uniref:hypothetical protein n=1 Tax=uncultured Dokdonia sp. TaxID=575653 RepID=UPI0034221051
MRRSVAFVMEHYYNIETCCSNAMARFSLSLGYEEEFVTTSCYVVAGFRFRESAIRTASAQLCRPRRVSKSHYLLQKSPSKTTRKQCATRWPHKKLPATRAV